MRTRLHLGAIAVAGVVLAACGGPKAPQGYPTLPVTVAKPLQQRVVDWDDFLGRFQARETVQVRARVGGYVDSVRFKEGDPVKKGQVLFTLDARPLRALLGQAQAQTVSAQAQLALAKSELARSESLLKTQAVSREEVETRRAAVDQGAAALQQAQANERARALDVEFTTVTAPVSGIISYRRIDPGNLVAGGSSTGDVLTTIVSVDPIYFYFDASEAQLLKYQRDKRARVAAPVRVRLQDEAQYRWNGELDFSDNAIDAATGAVRMRATVRNPNDFLKPGMFGHAQMRASSPYAALLIPADAVVADGAHEVAYVVGPDGTVGVRPLELGPTIGTLRAVRSGLSPGDLVVVNGVERVHPGQKAMPQEIKIAPPSGGEAPQTTVAPAPASVATLASAG